MKWKIRFRDAGDVESFIEHIAKDSLQREVDEKLRETIRRVGEVLHRGIVEKIETGEPGWPPLSEMTQELKGSAKPLVDKGELRDSIILTFDGAKAIVGITPEATRSDGTPMELVAGVMEYGASIPVTPRMRAFFAARGFPLRKETQVVVVPARPFFEPALEQANERVREVLDFLLDELIDTLQDK